MMMAIVARDPVLRVVSQTKFLKGRFAQDYDVTKEGRSRCEAVEERPQPQSAHVHGVSGRHSRKIDRHRGSDPILAD